MLSLMIAPRSQYLLYRPQDFQNAAGESWNHSSVIFNWPQFDTVLQLAERRSETVETRTIIAFTTWK